MTIYQKMGHENAFAWISSLQPPAKRPAVASEMEFRLLIQGMPCDKLWMFQACCSKCVAVGCEVN
jgi:hypothetical protein